MSPLSSLHDRTSRAKADVVVRLHDNHGLFQALKSGLPVLPVFIFDTEILGKLSSKTDARVSFIYAEIVKLKAAIEKAGSSLRIFHSTPIEVFEKLMKRRSQKRASRRIRVRSSSTRYIPKAVKQEVFARDKGQCSFVSKDGVRCCERKYLHFDHIHPYAKGGLTLSSYVPMESRQQGG